MSLLIVRRITHGRKSIVFNLKGLQLQEIRACSNVKLGSNSICWRNNLINGVPVAVVRLLGLDRIFPILLRTSVLFPSGHARPSRWPVSIECYATTDPK